jgi:hypothetical protein
MKSLSAVLRNERATPFVYRFAAVIVLVVLTLSIALCVANTGLLKYIGVGMLLGIMMWRLPMAVRLFVLFGAIVVLLAGCSASSGPPSPITNQWQVTYHVDIAVDSSGDRWVINEYITVPLNVLLQLPGVPASVAVVPRDLKSMRANAGVLAHEMGWQLIAIVNGNESKYHFGPTTIIHKIPLLPFTTVQDVNIWYGDDGYNDVLIPGPGSQVSITAPAGLIAATSPSSSPEATVTGEQRIINSFASAPDSESANVNISTMSVLVRAEPLRSLALLSITSWASFAVAGSWTFAVALLRRRSGAVLRRISGYVVGPEIPKDPKATAKADGANSAH